MQILIAEDELITRTMLKAFLKDRGFDVLDVDNGDAAWDILQQPDAPKLAVLDWLMPGKEGPEICRLLRSRKGADDSYTYVILLTGKSEKSDIIEGIEAGADDYMMKPFDRDELHVRVRAGQRIIELQTELLKTKQALADQANRDALTGILNRRGIMKALDFELSRARRNQAPLLISLCDADHFKQVNDVHGHLVGDEVLCAIVTRLNSKLRAYDHIGRYGGEEFLVIIPETCDTGSIAPVERLRESVAASPIITKAGDLPMTCSFGAVFTYGQENADELLRTVDECLYKAKRNGRNQVAFAPPKPPAV